MRGKVFQRMQRLAEQPQRLPFIRPLVDQSISSELNTFDDAVLEEPGRGVPITVLVRDVSVCRSHPDANTRKKMSRHTVSFLFLGRLRTLLVVRCRVDHHSLLIHVDLILVVRHPGLYDM